MALEAPAVRDVTTARSREVRLVWLCYNPAGEHNFDQVDSRLTIDRSPYAPERQEEGAGGGRRQRHRAAPAAASSAVQQCSPRRFLSVRRTAAATATKGCCSCRRRLGRRHGKLRDPWQRLRPRRRARVPLRRLRRRLRRRRRRRRSSGGPVIGGGPPVVPRRLARPPHPGILASATVPSSNLFLYICVSSSWLQMCSF